MTITPPDMLAVMMPACVCVRPIFGLGSLLMVMVNERSVKAGLGQMYDRCISAVELR